MSGGRVCSLLRELGYAGAEGLDPDSFEWPFQYDDARPILDWICSSLRFSNVLSLSELSQYLSLSLSLSLSLPFIPLSNSSFRLGFLNFVYITGVSNFCKKESSWRYRFLFFLFFYFDFIYWMCIVNTEFEFFEWITGRGLGLCFW